MSMNPEHVDAYISGELRDESAKFIEGSIRRDEELQDEIFLQAQIDQALRWMYAAEDEAAGDVDKAQGESVSNQLDDFVAGVMASVGGGDERTLARSVLTELLEEQGRKRRPTPWWDLAKAAAVAALAVVGTVVALNSIEVRDEVAEARREAVEESRVLAQITQERNAVWGRTSTVTRDGNWLSSGLLHLQKGLAEVTFDNGARAILEGPCFLDIQSPQRAFLRRGRMTVEVPPPAVGFVVNTPSMNVVDLGTRFGMIVDPDGTSEVHVMEGLVEATRSEGRAVPLQLREGLAVRADQRTRSRLMPIEYSGDIFALRVGGKSPAPASTVVYRFDEAVGPILEDSGSGFDDGPFELSLEPGNQPQWAKSTQPAQSTRLEHATPRRSTGRIGSGLVFRRGESVATAMPSMLNAFSGHTMACWIKLSPNGAKGADGVSPAILSLAPALADGGLSATGTDGELLAVAGWKISCNIAAADGPLGALRVDFGEGFVIGTTDLRDGRWHHIASRFVGTDPQISRPETGSGEGSESTPDIATHVRLFVDGELEATGAFRRQEITGSGKFGSGDREAVFFGLGSDARFEGSIDEVVISRGPLSPMVIYQLARQPERRPASY